MVCVKLFILPLVFKKNREIPNANDSTDIMSVVAE